MKHKKSNPKFVLHLTTTLATFFIVFPLLLYYPSLSYLKFLLKSSSQSTSTSSSSFSLSSTFSPPSPQHVTQDSAVSLRTSSEEQKCDLFTGEWVWDPDNVPYYTNETCSVIHDKQNCMKFGKPNLDYTKWRWKPNDCGLPIFNKTKALEILTGKSMAFVGDSNARNHMQSFICLLSNEVGYPMDFSSSSDPQTSKRYFYTDYNFTLSLLWSPYLVKTIEKNYVPNVYLDEADVEWTTQIHEFDYVIFSAGHWFFRSTMFYENGQLTGCQYCEDSNVTHISLTYGYRGAFRTAFRAINHLENFKGLIFLRTFTPSHFEGASWNAGGSCVRTRPYMKNETSLNGQNLEMYMTQVEEFRVAEREGMKKGMKFRLLDTTKAMWLRPDGHPNSYWHLPEEVGKSNDCVHWCLPGAIDTWNELLLEMLKREEVGKSVDAMVNVSDRRIRLG